MCFDVNTIFVNWPSFIHHTLLRLLTLWQPEADVSSLLSVFIIYRNSVSLQNTVQCSNSSNSASLKSTVSWVCTTSQSYSYNTVKISKVSKPSKSTLQMCITSPKCALRLSMNITSLNALHYVRLPSSVSFNMKCVFNIFTNFVSLTSTRRSLQPTDHS